MRLDVGVVGSEKLLGALDGEGFHDIHVFATAIPAFPGVALGIFVSEQRALRLHHSGRREVFRGDQLDVVPLAMLLADDGRVELGIGHGNPAAGGIANTRFVAPALELGGEKSAGHFHRGVDIGVFSGKAKHIGVVVFAGGDGFLDRAHTRGADVGMTVCGDAHAHAGCAGEDTKIKSAICNVAGNEVRIVRVVHRVRRVRSEILHLMPCGT